MNANTHTDVTLSDVSDDDEIEHFDDIDSLDEANQAAIGQGMAIRIQPPAPKATQYYFVDGPDWKRQTAGHKVAVMISVPRETVKSAIEENDQAGGGGAKAVSPETVETCPGRKDPVTDGGQDEDDKTLDDYVDQDAVVRIRYQTATSDQADGSMSFSDPKSFVMDVFEEGDGFIAGVDDDGREIYISGNKRINVREADEDGAARFLGYFRGFEEVGDLVTDGGVTTEDDNEHIEAGASIRIRYLSTVSGKIDEIEGHGAAVDGATVSVQAEEEPIVYILNQDATLQRRTPAQGRDDRGESTTTIGLIMDVSSVPRPVTDGGVVADDQTDLWTYGQQASERADTCPSGREWCEGNDTDEDDLCCFGCFEVEQ